MIAIISILAGLLLGPVMRAYHKARRTHWELQSSEFSEDLRDRLWKRFGEAQEYPAFSVEALQKAGIITTPLANFLKDRRVRYHPFSSSDPAQFVILEAQTGSAWRPWLVKASLDPGP